MSYSSKSKSSKNSSKYYTPLSNMSSGDIGVIKSNTSNSSKYYTPLSSNSKSITTSNLFITDKRIEKIQKFLQKYTLDDKYTLDNRVKYYKYLSNYIKDIKNKGCIKKYIEDNITKYTIGNKLFLIKKIGTESINGVIYLTIIKNILGGNLLACKIMPIDKDNYKEIKIMQYLTDKVISKKKSKHFLIMYKYIVCPPVSILELIKNPVGPLGSPLGRRDVSSNKRLVSINELAHGDLNMLMKNRKIVENNELMYNIFIQTFLSIASFHNLSKYYHGDAHSGNFLYQINKEKGYYHYRYNKTDYYLKACEYNIMIYDFGYATKAYKKYNKKSLLDYINIMNDAFIRTKWTYFSDLPSDDFNTTMIFIRDQLMIEYKSGNKEGNIEDIIVNNILLKALGNTSQTFNTFTRSKPSNIINKTPYILG